MSGKLKEREKDSHGQTETEKSGRERKSSRERQKRQRHTEKGEREEETIYLGLCYLCMKHREGDWEIQIRRLETKEVREQ